MGAMTSDTIELFDRVRARLAAAEKPFQLAAPATEADIAAARTIMAEVKAKPTAATHS